LENVLVIAATNTPDVLDPALLRPGRFDRKIVIPMPDVKAREQILRVHSKKRPLDQNVDLQIIAQHTYGFSGADIANLVNEASINAARKTDATTITAEDFDAAIDRITMGTKRDLHITEEQRWTTCVHEAGHTITALEKEKDGAAPLHKVTITPHGEALGITMMRPSQETYGYTLKELKSQLVVLFGGRVAEEIMLGGPEEVGTGASSDIQRATDIAWRMVTRFGFSELGPIRFGNSQEGYLGSSPESKLDATTSAKVYEQVSSIIRGAEEEARQILTAKRDDLERLARELMTKETMMAHEVRAVIGQAPTPS
jgi:cell division protease FtsH